MKIRTAALLMGFITILSFPSAMAKDGDASFGELKARLKKSLRAGDANKATGTIVRLVELNTKKAVKFLIERALRVDQYTTLNEHGKMLIFLAARQELPKVTDEKAREYLFQEAKRLKRPRDSDKKVFLTEIIGHMKGPDSEMALIPLLGQFKFDRVQLEAMQALARRRSPKAVDPLIRILELKEKNKDEIWKAAGQALIEITGYSFPTAADWKNFWAVRKGNWNPEKHRGDKKGSGFKTKEKGVPTFFDLEILYKRVVFVIDISKSMHIKDPVTGGEQPRRKPGDKETGGACPVCGDRHRGVGLPQTRMRVERVKRELARLIQSLPDDVKFNILAFSTEVFAWKPGSELIPASEQNLIKAVRWVEGLTFEHYTSTDRALEQAFAHREANAILLLSDGGPFRDHEPLPPQPIFDMVALQNKTRKVIIDTFGFSEDADKGFLKKLSKDNGGTFKSIN
ncbi:MAG: VWA domain-containing protein [Planctomycetota bacterium]|nr:VWA domain-containing protein [Planctomycetota bacterium]